MTISQRIFEIMEQKHLKQSDLASYIGIANSSVTDWKKKGSIPSADKIVKISEFLNVSTDYLLGRTEKPKEIINNGTSINQQYVDGNATANITSGKEKPMTNDTTIIQLIEAFQKLDFKNKTKVMSLIAELSE